MQDTTTAVLYAGFMTTGFIIAAFKLHGRYSACFVCNTGRCSKVVFTAMPSATMGTVVSYIYILGIHICIYICRYALLSAGLDRQPGVTLRWLSCGVKIHLDHRTLTPFNSPISTRISSILRGSRRGAFFVFLLSRQGNKETYSYCSAFSLLVCHYDSCHPAIMRSVP